MEFASTLDMIEEIQSQIDSHVEGLRKVSAKELGLDYRCRTAWVSDELDCIIVEKRDVSAINYFGGFEYVDKESVCELGDYTIYKNTDNRVQDALEHLATEDNEVEAEEEI